jgi:hypothetical protein
VSISKGEFAGSAKEYFTASATIRDFFSEFGVVRDKIHRSSAQRRKMFKRTNAPNRQVHKHSPARHNDLIFYSLAQNVAGGPLR